MFTNIARSRPLYVALRNSLPRQKALPAAYQVRLCSNEPAVKEETKSSSYRGVPKHQVRPIDRFFLVATGAYKSMKDVPDEVEIATIAKAQNKRRIFSSIFLCIFCAIGCYVAFRRGKYVIEHKIEDNLTMRNLKRDERNRAAAALQKKSQEATVAEAEAASKPEE